MHPNCRAQLTITLERNTESIHPICLLINQRPSPIDTWRASTNPLPIHEIIPSWKLFDRVASWIIITEWEIFSGIFPSSRENLTMTEWQRDGRIVEGDGETYVYWFALVSYSKRPWTPFPRCSRRCGIVAKGISSWTWSRGGNSCRRSCRGDWRTRAGRHVPRENRNGSQYYPRAWTRPESRASAASLSRLKRRKEPTLSLEIVEPIVGLFFFFVRPSRVKKEKRTCRLFILCIDASFSISIFIDSFIRG